MKSIKFREPKRIEKTEYIEIEYTYDALMEEWDKGDLIYELAKRCKELEEELTGEETSISKLNELIYCVQPSRPFANDGWTWKQQCELEQKRTDNFRQAYYNVVKMLRELLNKHDLNYNESCDARGS